MLFQGYESYDKSKLENTTEEDVQTKVRLTALMTLGARSTHELKFAEVQQALGLGSDSEVEAWVVRAIGKVCSFEPVHIQCPVCTWLHHESATNVIHRREFHKQLARHLQSS